MSKVKHFETVSGKIVKTAEFDGYSIADRLLEGLMFQISVQEDGTLNASVKEKDKAYFSDFNQEKFLKLAVEYAYENDIFYDPTSGEECCIVFETSVKDINDMSEEDDETEEDDSSEVIDIKLSTINEIDLLQKKSDEVEEVKEIIIGDFKPKRKFLSFVSSVNGAKVRFIRDIAFVKGEKLSGLLDGVIFKITICDEDTINFEEQVEDGKEPVSNPGMIKRLIADIDDIDVTGYANKFVLSGLPFSDTDGRLCYLEVEHKKPIDILSSIFEEQDKEEENMNISEKGLSVLDKLFADEEKTDKVNSILDKLFSDDEDSLDQVMNSDLEDITEVEVVEEPKVESYMEESFRKMNEQKVKELNSRIEEKQKDIFKFKSEIKQAETKVNETSEQLGILETRLETMTPGDKPNGYVFFVSEEQKIETGLDETTRNIADKIADIMKLKKDVLFDYLTGCFYNIKIGNKDDITKELELNKEFQKLFNEKIKTIDVEGSFSVQAEKDVIEYRGKLNWHQLVSKFIRNGFEQDGDFDKLSGSNSYESKTEEVETSESDNVTDSDFDEVKTETKSSTTKEFMTIGEWNTPTDLVVLGTSCDEDTEFKEALSINDELTSLDIRRGGKKMKAFTSIETAGSFSVISLDEYQKFINGLSEDNVEFISGLYDALLLPKFVGKLEIGIKQNGNWVTDKSILTEEFVVNLPGVEHILLNIQEGQKVIKIEDHANYQKSDTKEIGDYKVLESYSTPTDFVIVGVDYDGRDIEITDDYYRSDIYLNGNPFQLSNWGCGVETEGHVSIMTINRYKKWVKEFGEDCGDSVEAILVTGFTGDVTVGCKTEDGEFSTDFDFGDYILHQVDDGAEVIINLIDKSGDISIHQIENHDLNKIVPYVRDMRLKEILGEK